MSGNSRWLSRGQRDGGRGRPRTTGDSQMRTTSFILAFAFILAGPSMAGSSDQDLPGVGTSPIMARRLRCLRPSRWSWPPTERDGSSAKRSPIKARYVLRICSAAILTCFLLSSAAQAQAQVQLQFQPPQTSFRSLFKMPDPRAEFVRLCMPHMVGRWAHPESVCGCLHDHAAATVEDADLREALLRGISETGVQTMRPRGCRRQSNPKSARPSPRSPSRRCNACSSRRRTSKVARFSSRSTFTDRPDTPVTAIVSDGRSRSV